MDPVRYWDMSLREIQAAIEAHNERYRADMQSQAIISFRQAHLIGALVAKTLGGKGKIPPLEEAFPGIFPEDMFRQQRQDWRVMKDRVASYGERRRKRGEQRGDNGRGVTSPNHGGDKPAPPGPQQSS